MRGAWVPGCLDALDLGFYPTRTHTLFQPKKGPLCVYSGPEAFYGHAHEFTDAQLARCQHP